MRSFFAFFVDRSLLVNLVTVAAMVFGVAAFLDVPRTLMPQIDSRTVMVTAEFPGASAVEVERQVTFRLEEVLQDLRGLDELTSETTNGAAVVTLEFEPGHHDMAGALEQAKGRVQRLDPVLPRELRSLDVQLQSADQMPGPSIHMVGADDAEPAHRRAAELLIERLRRVPSVVAVPTSLRRQDLHVVFDPERLDARGIDITAARAAVAAFLRYAPVGALRQGDEDIAVEVFQGFDGVDSLLALPLATNRAGYGVRLRDVAEVELRLQDTRTTSLRDGEPTVQLMVMHAAEGDTVAVSERVRAVVEGFDRAPEGVLVEVADDPSELVSHELGVLQNNALAGFVIVLGILLLFLGWRVAAMTAIGLPFCYLGGIVVIDALGITFNLISLLSLILVLGIVVDDAIIVAEAFSARRRRGMAPREAAIDAAHDMFRPVLGMMLTTAVAYLPILILADGNARPLSVLPIVVMTLLLLSLLESFLLLPNHLAHFAPGVGEQQELRVMAWARELYRRVLRLVVRLRYVTVLLFGSSFVAAGVLVTQHMEVIGSKNLGDGVVVHVALPESDSLRHTHQVVRPLEQAMMQADVRYVVTEIGQSTVGGRTLHGMRYASIEAVPPGSMAEREVHFDDIEAHMRPALQRFEAEGHGTAQLVVEYEQAGRDVIQIFVSGTDRIDFHAVEARIAEALQDVDGVQRVFVDPDRLQQTWRFAVDLRAAQTYGLSADAIAAQLRQHVPGPYLDRVRLAGQEMQVFTHTSDELSPEEGALRDVTVMTPRAIAVPLQRLGRWERLDTMKRIEHRDLLRIFSVDALFDPEATSSEEVAQAIETALAPVRDQWPGYHISVEEPEGEAEFRSWAIKVVVMLCGLMYVILALSLNSLVQPLLVMTAIPFGLTGVIFALYAHGMDFEILAIMGVLGLIGVVVNDALVVMDTVRREREERAEEVYTEVVCDGAARRFQAVVLTSLTTLGGVFPLAYGIMGDAGWIQPMVFALGWGLAFATLLTLVLLPCLLAIVDDGARLGRWLQARLRRG
ncbi:MAG: efflux RND transporter permease subunit [Myxococcales bacterium]|nr:efflux RND transporter permease subunit [Myxococcales bacterium]